MKTTTNATLYAYWNSVRGTRIAPRRFEIEPSRIADILSETFILELNESGTFTYRLAGTAICDVMGRELRGTRFLEVWRDTDRFALQRHLTSVRKLGAIARVMVEGLSAEGRPVRFEILVLPLFHNGETVDRFLGGFAAMSPRQWLEALPVEDFRILETELTYPSEGVEFPNPVSRAPALDYAPPAVASNVRTARIVRHENRQFRVYEGGLSQQGDES